MVESSETLRWLPEAPALALAGVPRGTWSSWAKNGMVERPANGAYSLADVMRVAVIGQMRRVLPPDALAAASRALHRSDIDLRLMQASAGSVCPSRSDLVIEPDSGRISLVDSDAALIDAVRYPASPRTVIVLDIAAETARVYDGFMNRATSGGTPALRRPGRPRKVELQAQPGRR